MQINKFLMWLIIFFNPQLYSFDFYQSKTFTIMINPAGDAKDAGRMLNDSFERGITLQFAQELKKSIETIHPNTRVILTRIPGETLEFLQNANFANRLDVDFYLSIHFYKETDIRSKLFLYHYLCESFYTKPFNDISLIRYNKAHLINIDKTINYIEHMKKTFKNNTQFDFVNCIGIPFKPLIGIKSPAIALEIGLKESTDFKYFIDPVLQSLEFLF